MSSGPSRCWPVRGSPVPRRVTGHAALVQFSNPVRQPARHRRNQNRRSRNRPNPTSRRGHAPTAPAGPVLRQQGFHSHRDRGHIATVHSDASTAPRIDSLDTMSGPAAIASLNPAVVAREIDRIQTKLNHPAGLKPTASKNSPEERTRPHLPTLICPASPTSDAAPANPKISLGQPHEISRRDPWLFPITHPPITHTPVPRETGQRTWVTHKSPPASNTDQAMNLFKDKTIKLLNRAMRTA